MQARGRGWLYLAGGSEPKKVLYVPLASINCDRSDMNMISRTMSEVVRPLSARASVVYG